MKLLLLLFLSTTIETSQQSTLLFDSSSDNYAIFSPAKPGNTHDEESIIAAEHERLRSLSNNRKDFIFSVNVVHALAEICGVVERVLHEAGIEHIFILFVSTFDAYHVIIVVVQRVNCNKFALISDNDEERFKKFQRKLDENSKKLT
jgi:hypothetical protein